MNGFEANKLFGAGVGALLIFLLFGLVAESIYHVEPPRTRGYAVEVAAREAAAPAEAAAEAAPVADLPTRLAAADPAVGEKAFKKCAACHKLAEGVNAVGPSLWGVVGRPVQAIEGFKYSGALGKVGGVWSFENLDAFIRKPKDWAPGTSMSFAGLADDAERAAVIVYLNQADGSPEPLPQ